MAAPKTKAAASAACQHRVQLVHAKAVVGDLCKLRTLCTACSQWFTHTFTGSEAEEAARAWYYVPPGLPPRRKGGKQ